jgi:hypothetical protein
VSRRARLPGASELFFRKTTDIAGTDGSSGSKPRVPRRGSPRVKHDTKITVYLSQQELLALEQARLTLRAEHDLRVDRGRLVREAVAVMLADLEVAGRDSVLVRRLRSDGEEEAEAARRAEEGGTKETVA